MTPLEKSARTYRALLARIAWPINPRTAEYRECLAYRRELEREYGAKVVQAAVKSP